MDEKVLYRETIAIAGNDFEHGGDAAAKVKAIMKEFGLDAAVIRRLSIANFEAEMNVIMYADAGELEFTVDRGGGTRGRDRPTDRGSPTSTSRCRKGTRRPRPRCGRGASARAWDCRTSGATTDWFEVESHAGRRHDASIRGRFGTASGASATN